jgi:hypothetical protein
MKGLLTSFFLVLGTAFAQSNPSTPLNASQFRELAHRCVPDAPLPTLRLIVGAESGFHAEALALHVTTVASDGSLELERQPRSLDEALRWSRWLTTEGIDVGVGLMGIRIQDLQEMLLPLERAFEPCMNLRIGWVLFQKKYHAAATVLGNGQAAVQAALLAYEGNPTSRRPGSLIQSILEAAEGDSPAGADPAGESNEPEATQLVRRTQPYAVASELYLGGQAAADSDEALKRGPKSSTTKLEWDMAHARTPWTALKEALQP